MSVGMSAASGGPIRKVAWRDEQTLEVDGVELVARTKPRFDSTADQFCLVKRPDLVARYLDLLGTLRPATVVELGIFQGGSVMLTALVADPETLVAVDLSAERVAALDVALAARGLTDRVHLAYGVDQSDLTALSSVIEAAGIHRPSIDLVVDDASHLVGPTRASFDLLFPLLRPGGRYVIEDWSWAHIGFGTHLPEEQPLTEVVFELTMALPSVPGVISGIEIDRDWAVVTRGEAPIDPRTFSLSSLYSERGRRLLASTDP